MGAADFSFDQEFLALTGQTPLSWQRRLFEEHFAAVDADGPEQAALPTALDIPTGLGKTSVMAIWLLARAHPDEAVRAGIPRRLVYVVDRRAVVDQATAEAEKICQRLDRAPALKQRLGLAADTSLPISTLRGQHVDNQDWLVDPMAPAIIVGTVDMVGSRLLFSGYGVSPKMRPFHAGLLGADTLVVLDEAHLVPSFEALLETIARDSTLGPSLVDDRKIVPRFQLMSLSATGRTSEETGTGRVFRLKPEDRGDRIVNARLGAAKHLSMDDVADTKALVAELAERAWKLATEPRAARVLVYCDRRDDALGVKKAIEGLAKKTKIETQLLVGARRVHERDALACWLQAHGLISRPDGGADEGPAAPTFLIATSAGEVGVDLDADHMVCDLVAWERMVQRFGRVNRLGRKVSMIEVVAAPSKDSKKDGEKWEERFSRLSAPLDSLRRDASPGAIVKLKERADPELQARLRAASTPPPLRPALTRAVVEAWAMTSLEEHSGRPEIQPWLRGWQADDEPQTQVVWRKHLPVRRSGSEATPEEIDRFFEAAPPQMSEMLETETWRITDWLLKRAGAMLKAEEKAARGTETFVAIKDRSVLFVLNSRNELDRAHAPQWTLGELTELDEKENKKKREAFDASLRGRTIIVCAALGGLDDDGMLDEDWSAEADAIDTGEIVAADADGNAWKARPFAVVETTAPKRVIEKDWKQAHRFAVDKSEDDETRWLVVYEHRRQAETEDSRAVAPHEQALAIHQKGVVRNVRRIAHMVGLSAGHVSALAVAARLHDEGKALWRWQRAFNAPRDGEVYAKTKGPLNVKLLDGYRHEFTSLWKIRKDPEFMQLDPKRQDLVLHLVAAHHGFARPVISARNCEEGAPERMARDVALRFARLQKQWGPWGLAWWEALLRAADQQASRESDQRNDEKAEAEPAPDAAEETA